MTACIVTPAEAREMVGDETEWRWEDSLCASNSIVAVVYDDESEDDIVHICGPLPSLAFAQRRARLVVSAPCLAATVASEPERVEAAVAAERDAIIARIDEASVSWGALTRSQQDLVAAFADYLAGVIRGRRAP